ncbi:MMPL family transporter [Allobranchiibius huperziae]|uniref:RND superfamily putative drug exporter n=1 Tax=Allobranchiibius huperziae TaxID=1874116 RepID=A0A853D881_9MICO|nr:MMPL family transporter [Allobranchiibius huperziae]NYJ73168.1 RND superfamily putative drug exporter [Allobranchiibius huperziae]
MATALYRLGRTAYRKWPFFLIGWLIALIGLGGLSQAIHKPLVDTFSIPGIPSLKAQSMQQKLFPGTGDAVNQAGVSVVVGAPKGHTLKEAKYSNAVDALITDLQKVPQMPKTKLVNPVTASAAQFKAATSAAAKQGTPKAVAERNANALLPLSPDGRIGTIDFAFDVKTVQDVKPATQNKVVDDLKKARASGLTAEVNGAGMQIAPDPGGSSELIGVAFAAVVLIITFGSLIAAGMPILSAFVGVAMGTIGVQLATAFTTVGTTTPILSSMIGLAVGIDYTLFILSRYRTELRTTDDRAHAVGLAVGKAGTAVVFAGLTVLIALIALSVVGIPFLTAMGLAAAETVFFAVLVALTLLPAVLGMFKSKAFGAQVRKRSDKRDDQGHAVNNGTRWARLVGRKPAIVVALVVVVLGAIAVPAKSLHLALPSDSTAAKSTTQRKAADLQAEAFGPGRAAPLLVVVDGTNVTGGAKARTTAYGKVATWAGTKPDVANAQIVGLNKAGTGAQVLITPKSGADDEKTLSLLHALRDGQSGIEKSTGTTVGVTGLVAIQTDVSDRLTGALPVYLAVVIGLAFLVLMVVFRSVLVPLVATLGFLLSILATLGATVEVFQKGRFGIVEGAPLVSFMPIILIGIVFGLAMDYQVFLVTRMREAHVHGMSARDAVVDGFRNSARVVAAAAAIMISVFAAFILQGVSFIMSIGFALAVAVFFDAFVVRMTLMPALLFLLGERAWWLPKWLDRILPKVDVEGEKLTGAGAPHEQRHPAHLAEPEHSRA